MGAGPLRQVLKEQALAIALTDDEIRKAQPVDREFNILRSLQESHSAQCPASDTLSARRPHLTDDDSDS
jgi:hypothetical protein